MTVHTVGHSSRSLDDFLALLAAHAIRTVVDVRAYPRSRRLPHFDGDVLGATLARHRIAYHQLPALGGMRAPADDASPNTGWTDPGFRAYADHTRTPLFAAAIDTVLALAARLGPVAIMCAEKDWRRCHRQMIADALLVRGVAVRHLLSATEVEDARLTPFAERRDDHLVYPAPQGALFREEHAGRDAHDPVE